ncbi:hypothetical protein [Dactylosporangium darangshiense]|uniref:hypothetical protein n=1 Tax=Dactylosporangium darangshiense TaxID=579108 RepID=UPI0036307EB8
MRPSELARATVAQADRLTVLYTRTAFKYAVYADALVVARTRPSEAGRPTPVTVPTVEQFLLDPTAFLTDIRSVASAKEVPVGGYLAFALHTDARDATSPAALPVDEYRAVLDAVERYRQVGEALDRFDDHTSVHVEDMPADPEAPGNLFTEPGAVYAVERPTDLAEALHAYAAGLVHLARAPGEGLREARTSS